MKQLRTYALLLFIFITLAHSSASFARTDEPIPPNQQTTNQYTTNQLKLLADHEPIQNLASAALTPCIGGIADTGSIQYECDSIDLAAFMSLADLGGGSSNANDIWGWTDEASGREFAILGRNDRTVFAEITDPINPVYIGQLPAHDGVSTLWRDVKTYQNYALIVSESGTHGVQIFDLTRLLTATPPSIFTNNAWYGGIGDAHNIVVNEDTGYAYAVGSGVCSGGLHMIDIRNPLTPTNAGCFASDGYTHDAQCVLYHGPDADYYGQEICFNANADTLTIVDVTDKSNPIQIERVGYNNHGYSHQGWLTPDHAYMIFGDELDERNLGHNTRTRIFNLTNLDVVPAPVIYDGPNGAIDHNLYTRGHYVFESNYRAGLYILNTNDVANGNLNQVAFFDLYPGSNSSNFNGNWSNYPYFDSGTIIASHMEAGLFIFQPTIDPDFELKMDTFDINVCGTGSGQLPIQLDDMYGYNSNVTLSVSNLPAGVSANFDNNTVTVPGTATLTLNNTSAAQNDYIFKVTATDSTLTTDQYLRLSIQPAVGVPALSSPNNGATDESLQATLTWTAAATAQSYTVEVATDSGFTNIVYTTTTANLTATTPELNAFTTYYWRITAHNECSEQTSAVYSFTTGALASCQLYTAADLPLRIPQTPGSYSGTTISDIVVTNGTTSLSSVSLVDVNGTHGRVGQINFSLTSPSGNNQSLWSAACGNDDNFFFSLSDSAPAGTPPCPPTDMGTYQPTGTGSFAAYTGEDSNGTWSLTVADNASSGISDGTGELLGWGLEICGYDLCAPPDDITMVNASTNATDIILNWTSNGADEYQIWWSTTPYILPGVDCASANTCDTTTSNTYTHTGMGQNPATNYFYHVLGYNSCGATSAVTNYTGVFDYALTIGTAQ
ncbi:MAG TPA: choice-of-anchor B family protein [Anaerolineae bacterium]|nr:choice-of-anchor B family protein [Anaerolineae bacterium]